jgi:hypothetical protein
MLRLRAVRGCQSISSNRAARAPPQRCLNRGANVEHSKEARSMASKYTPLANHLRRQSGLSHSMSFAAIEDLVGPLPTSARTYKPWWDNHHSHTQAMNGWLAAGWRVHLSELDLDRETVAFRR